MFFVERKHFFVERKHLFVGTQDLCVQSNKTGSNKTGSNKTGSNTAGSNTTGSNTTIPIWIDALDGMLDWTGRKDLASLQTNVRVPTNRTFLEFREQ
jgi:hypothetical protein